MFITQGYKMDQVILCLFFKTKGRMQNANSFLSMKLLNGKKRDIFLFQQFNKMLNKLHFPNDIPTYRKIIQIFKTLKDTPMFFIDIQNLYPRWLWNVILSFHFTKINNESKNEDANHNQ